MMSVGGSCDRDVSFPALPPRDPAGAVARHPARGDLLSPAAHHELRRLEPDAQPGDPDRARHHRADVRDHRQRPRPLHRRLRQPRRLRLRNLAERHAGHGRAGAAGAASRPPGGQGDTAIQGLANTGFN